MKIERLAALLLTTAPSLGLQAPLPSRSAAAFPKVHTARHPAFVLCTASVEDGDADAQGRLRKVAGTVGKAAGTVGKAAGTVGKQAGTEATDLITWLAMMLAVPVPIIMEWQRSIAVFGGLGLAAAALAVSSPWSRPLALWRVLVKMGAGGMATAATAVAAGVTAGVAMSGVYGIWLGLARGNKWGGVRPSDVRSAIKFGVPAWFLAGAAGALSSRTVALAPTFLQAPLKIALLVLLAGGGGGSFTVMLAMANADLEDEEE